MNITEGPTTGPSPGHEQSPGPGGRNQRPPNSTIHHLNEPATSSMSSEPLEGPLMSNYTPVGPSGDQPWSSEHSGASLHDLPAPTKTEVSRDYEVTPEMFSSHPGGLLDRRRQSQARSKGAEVYSILSETVQISSRSEMADLKPDSKLSAPLSDSKSPPERLLKDIANHQATADSATPGVWSDTAALPRVANDIPMFKHLLNTLGGDSSLFFSESSITDAINWKEEEQDFYWLDRRFLNTSSAVHAWMIRNEKPRLKALLQTFSSTGPIALKNIMNFTTDLQQYLGIKTVSTLCLIFHALLVEDQANDLLFEKRSVVKGLVRKWAVDVHDKATAEAFLHQCKGGAVVSFSKTALDINDDSPGVLCLRSSDVEIRNHYWHIIFTGLCFQLTYVPAVQHSCANLIAKWSIPMRFSDKHKYVIQARKDYRVMLGMMHDDYSDIVIAAKTEGLERLLPKEHDRIQNLLRATPREITVALKKLTEDKTMYPNGVDFNKMEYEEFQLLMIKAHDFYHQSLEQQQFLEAALHHNRFSLAKHQGDKFNFTKPEPYPTRSTTPTTGKPPNDLPAKISYGYKPTPDLKHFCYVHGHCSHETKDCRIFQKFNGDFKTKYPRWPHDPPDHVTVTDAAAQRHEPKQTQQGVAVRSTVQRSNAPKITAPATAGGQKQSFSNHATEKCQVADSLHFPPLEVVSHTSRNKTLSQGIPVHFNVTSVNDKYFQQILRAAKEQGRCDTASMHTMLAFLAVDGNYLRVTVTPDPDGSFEACDINICSMTDFDIISDEKLEALDAYRNKVLLISSFSTWRTTVGVDPLAQCTALQQTDTAKAHHSKVLLMSGLRKWRALCNTATGAPETSVPQAICTTSTPEMQAVYKLHAVFRWRQLSRIFLLLLLRYQQAARNERVPHTARRLVNMCLATIPHVPVHLSQTHTAAQLAEEHGLPTSEWCWTGHQQGMHGQAVPSYLLSKLRITSQEFAHVADDRWLVQYKAEVPVGQSAPWSAVAYVEYRAQVPLDVLYPHPEPVESTNPLEDSDTDSDTLSEPPALDHGSDSESHSDTLSEPPALDPGSDSESHSDDENTWTLNNIIAWEQDNWAIRHIYHLDSDYEDSEHPIVQPQGDQHRDTLPVNPVADVYVTNVLPGADLAESQHLAQPSHSSDTAHSPSSLPACIVHDDSGRAIITGFDSMSEVSLISDDIIHPDWCQQALPDPVTMRTAAGIAARVLQSQVELRLALRWGADAVTLWALVTPRSTLPVGMDLIMGTPAITAFGITLDLRNERAICESERLVLHLEPVHTFVTRRQFLPIRGLHCCSGVDPLLSTMKDLGIPVALWVVCESDPTCIAVLKALHPEVIVFTDIYLLELEDVKYYKFNFLAGGTPCNPWSRLQSLAPDQGGFNHPEAAIFVQLATIKQWIQQTHPNFLYFIETVVPAAALRQDETEQDRLMQASFFAHQAADWGSPSSRQRRLATNIVNQNAIAAIPSKQPVHPSCLLGDDVEPILLHTMPTVPCIVAALNTHNPPMVRSRQSLETAQMSVDEKETMMGFPPGLTDGGLSPFTQGPLHLPESVRAAMAGRAFNVYQLTPILQLMKPMSSMTPVQLAHFTTEIQNVNTDVLEAQLSTMTDEQLDEYFAMVKTERGYQPPELYVEEKPGQAVPYQTKHDYSGKDIAAEEYQLSIEVKEGRMAGPLPYDPHMWYSSLYFNKKERLHAGTNYHQMRPLWVGVFVNAALAAAPWHWVTMFPTVETMLKAIPLEAGCFIFCDYKTAYGAVKIHKSCQYLFGALHNGKYYNYLTMPQGLAHGALFWNCWITHGYNALLGNHWRQWWSGFVDDYTVFAPAGEETKCKHRARILLAVSKALGVTISDKCDMHTLTVRDHVTTCGFTVRQGGNVLSEEAVDVLRVALATKPTSKKMLMHMIGVVLYSRSAFEWDPASLSQYNELMRPLQKAVSDEGKFKWTPELQTCVDRLSSMITLRPRATRDLFNILHDKSCFAIMHDASNVGSSAALFIVSHGNAEQVQIADLQDPNKSQLIDTVTKMYDKGMQNWSTWEQELHSRYLGTVKWGSYLNGMFQRLAQERQINMVELETKLVFVYDSATAEKKFIDFIVPQETAHVSAKRLRFWNMYDEISFVKNWPCNWHGGNLQTPSQDNSLAHVMSHIGTQLAELERQRQTEKDIFSMEVCTYPISIHSYHGKENFTDAMAPPPGYNVLYLPIAPGDAKFIAAAYAQDHTKINGVPISAIYDVLMHPKQESQHADTIKAWAGVRFFLINLPRSGIPLLFTIASMQVMKGEQVQNIADFTTPTKNLVMVIPLHASARIVSAERVCENDDHDKDHYMNMYLWEDILWLSHDAYTPHPSIIKTVQHIQRIAWRPKLLETVKNYVHTCVECIPKLHAKPTVGMAIASHMRFAVIALDHYVMDQDMAAACDVLYIMGAACISTNNVLFVDAPDMASRTTARLIITEWVPRWGVPILVLTDAASNLQSSLIKDIWTLLGVAGTERSAAHSDTHQPVIERAFATLDNTLNTAYNRGQLTSPEALRFYMRQAEVTLNHTMDYGNATAFERATGQIARNQVDILDTNGLNSISVSQHSDLDQQLVDQVRTLTTDMLDVSNARKEERARRNVLYRDTKVAASRVTQFDLRKGDRVSYDGNAFELVTDPSHDPGGEGPVQIRDLAPPHGIKTVMYDALSPTGTPRPVLELPKQLDTSVGNFAFFQVDNEVFGGVIIAETDTVIHIQEYVSTASNKRQSWLPMWNLPSGKIIRKGHPPPQNAEPEMYEVPLADIIITGKLTDRTLDENLTKHLMTQGVLAPLKFTLMGWYDINSDLWVATAYLPDGYNVVVLFDTGASMSVASMELLERIHKYKTDTQDVEFLTASTLAGDITMLSVTYHVPLNFECATHSNNSVVCSLLTAPSHPIGVDIIVGTDMMQFHDITCQPRQRQIVWNGHPDQVSKYHQKPLTINLHPLQQLLDNASNEGHMPSTCDCDKPIVTPAAPGNGSVCQPREQPKSMPLPTPCTRVLAPLSVHPDHEEPDPLAIFPECRDDTEALAALLYNTVYDTFPSDCDTLEQRIKWLQRSSHFSHLTRGQLIDKAEEHRLQLLLNRYPPHGPGSKCSKCKRVANKSWIRTFEDDGIIRVESLKREPPRPFPPGVRLLREQDFEDRALCVFCRRETNESRRRKRKPSPQTARMDDLRRENDRLRHEIQCQRNIVLRQENVRLRRDNDRLQRETARLQSAITMLTSTPAQRGSAFQPAQRSPPRARGMHVLLKQRGVSTTPVATPSPSHVHTRDTRLATLKRQSRNAGNVGELRHEPSCSPQGITSPAYQSQSRDHVQLQLHGRNPLHPTPPPSAGTPASAFLDLVDLVPISPRSMRTDVSLCDNPASGVILTAEDAVELPHHNTTSANCETPWICLPYSPGFATPKGVPARNPVLPVRRQLYRDCTSCNCACMCVVISGLCIVVLLCIGTQAHRMITYAS